MLVKDQFLFDERRRQDPRIVYRWRCYYSLIRLGQHTRQIPRHPRCWATSDGGQLFPVVWLSLSTSSSRAVEVDEVDVVHRSFPHLTADSQDVVPPS